MILSDRKFDFVVIGGGATGYLAALSLATLDRSVILFAPPVRDHPARTAALLHSSTQILDEFGLWQPVCDKAAALVRMRLIDGSRRLIRSPEVTFDAREIGLPAFGHNIANHVLVDAMADIAAKDHRLRIEACAAEGLERTEDGWRVSWKEGAAEATFLVGADGRKSLAADTLRIGRRLWSYRQAALVGLVRCAEPHRDTSTEFHCAGGPITLVPMPGDMVSLVWVDRPGRVTELLEQSDQEFASILEKHVSSILGRLEMAGPRVSFPLSGMRATELGGEHAVLVGEAAHVIPPIGAQGLNLGIRDVACLHHLVASSRKKLAPASIVTRYQRDRQADIRSRSLAVDLLNRSLLTDFLPVQAARSLGMHAMHHIPVVRQMLMKQSIGGRFT